MRLSDLIGESGIVGLKKDPDIAGLTADSRAIEPGYLFAALPGATFDGRNFIADALARGAAAVLAPAGTRLPKTAAGVPLIPVENPRHALSLFAARFHDGQPRIAAAVTGTNGKTSVAWFTRRIWAGLGHRPAAMGTLGMTADDVEGNFSSGLTTADPVALHQDLRRLSDAGVDHVVIEASSHGLEQARLDGVKFAAAAFTNLTRDHLDHHGTMDAYRAAKLRLFDTVLPETATAVLNSDSDEFALFSSVAHARGLRVIGYGRTTDDIRIESVESVREGQKISLSLFGKPREVVLPLPGVFQARNALCALGLAVACGDDADDALALLATLDSPPGRMELAGKRANGATVYIDYAHTPDALSTVLGALRPHTAGRLVVAFGCGGDRDAGKRPEMGSIARDLADLTVVTDDNPRSETPATIRAEILAACPDATVIGDRAEAIHHAISTLGPADTLVIAGKGHETGQVVGSRVDPFDDAAVARAAIAALDGRGT